MALLFKEGGAIEVQKIINSHLSKTGSEMFFLNVRHILNNLIAWHKWNGIVVLEEGVEPELQDEIILVRCLQLFCEGHFGPNQDILREQPNNSVSINLLDDFVAYLQALDALKCRTSTAAQLKVAATILEVIQGPCEGNQDYFALNTELIETLNKMIRQRPVHDCDEDEETDLKKSAIEIFQGLLEGQGSKTAIYERMLSVIHIDVIQVLACGLTETSDKEESEDSIALKTESLVLLQMLTDFRPSLKKELGLDTDDSDGINDDTVACVEVVWRGELQRRFFHVPDICSALAKSTKDNFVQNVKRTSQEDKLYGLLEASKEMYREILHQNTLKNYKVDMIFSRTNIVRITWISFYVVVLVNILFVIGYSSPRDTCTVDVKEGCGVVTLDPSIKPVVNALILLLIVLSFFTLTLYLVVGVPLNYRTHQEKGLGFMKCVLYTALDPYVLYYIICMGVAVSGYFYHALITLLTLDFVSKSPTARGVLRAVWNPRKQLIMTLILTMIIVYIFSMFLVR